MPAVNYEHEWEVVESCVTDPFPVMLCRVSNPDLEKQPFQTNEFLHAVVGLNEKGEIINAISNSLEYMAKYDGGVFRMMTFLPKEIYDAVDRDIYLVYHDKTQRFIQMPIEEYRNLKEL